MRSFLMLVLSLFVVSCTASTEESTASNEAAFGWPSGPLCNGTRCLEVNETSYRDGLHYSRMKLRDGTHPLNKFYLHRVSKPYTTIRGSVFLLPSLNSSFAEYEWADNGHTFRDSFAGYLAANGYVVWGFSPRTTSVPANHCATNDCSAMSSWGFSTYVADVNFARNIIRIYEPWRKPFVGGLSFGTMLAFAVVNQAPTDYAGLIAWEGMLFSPDVAFQGANDAKCDALEARLASGSYADDSFFPLASTAYQLATTNPNGPSPFPFFPGFNNQQAFVGLFAYPSPGVPFEIPVRGFIVDAGNPPAGTFTFADQYRVGQNVLTGNYYESVKIERDIACSFAGARTWTNNLCAFKGPVLAIKAGLGFGEHMEGTLGLLGSTNVTRITHSGYGHADHYLTANHRAIVETPVKNWLDSKTP